MKLGKAGKEISSNLEGKKGMKPGQAGEEISSNLEGKKGMKPGQAGEKNSNNNIRAYINSLKLCLQKIIEYSSDDSNASIVIAKYAIHNTREYTL